MKGVNVKVDRKVFGFLLLLVMLLYITLVGLTVTSIYVAIGCSLLITVLAMVVPISILTKKGKFLSDTAAIAIAGVNSVCLAVPFLLIGSFCLSANNYSYSNILFILITIIFVACYYGFVNFLFITKQEEKKAAKKTTKKRKSTKK